MPLKAPASDHDWQGGPPIIPSISPLIKGEISSFVIFLTSPSIRWVSGWLILKVANIVGSNSLATGISNPAFSKRSAIFKTVRPSGIETVTVFSLPEERKI